MSVPRKLLSTISPMTLGVTAAAAGIFGLTGITYANSNPGSRPTCPNPSFQSQKPALGSKKTLFPNTGFLDLTLEEAKVLNHDTKELRFRLPGDGDAVSGLGPISSLLTRHRSQGSWIPTFRPYTPTSTADSTTITLVVKKYPDGKASTHLHDMEPGETLSLKSLPSQYAYEANTHRNVLMIAGGAGITPMFQLATHCLGDIRDETKLCLVYAANSPKDLLLKEGIDVLAKRFPDRFRAIYVVTNPVGKGQNDGFEMGYVTKEILKKALPDGAARDHVKVLVCGPPAMMDAVAGKKGLRGWTQGKIGGALKELGFLEKDVHKF